MSWYIKTLLFSPMTFAFYFSLVFVAIYGCGLKEGESYRTKVQFSGQDSEMREEEARVGASQDLEVESFEEEIPVESDHSFEKPENELEQDELAMDDTQDIQTPDLVTQDQNIPEAEVSENSLPSNNVETIETPVQPKTCSQVAFILCSYVKSLLSERAGHGRKTGGGLNGEVYTVTTLNDSGVGSLRQALESTKPLWIKFSKSGTIKLKKAIRMKSKKTLDGRGAKVTVTNHGIDIIGISDVIVNDLKFVDGKDDGITVKESKKVWIHHNDISNFEDGLVDVTRESSSVTISWNKLHRHNKGMIIGLQKKHSNEKSMFVTVHHNIFEKVIQRSPRVAQAQVHFYNNYVKDWKNYAISSSEGGEVSTLR